MKRLNSLVEFNRDGFLNNNIQYDWEEYGELIDYFERSSDLTLQLGLVFDGLHSENDGSEETSDECSEPDGSEGTKLFESAEIESKTEKKGRSFNFDFGMPRSSTRSSAHLNEETYRELKDGPGTSSDIDSILSMSFPQKISKLLKKTRKRSSRKENFGRELESKILSQKLWVEKNDHEEDKSDSYEKYYGRGEKDEEEVESKKFSCSTCQRKFSSKDYARRHNQRVHSASKFDCLYCDIGFSRIDNMKAHIKKFHR